MKEIDCNKIRNQSDALLKRLKERVFNFSSKKVQEIIKSNISEFTHKRTIFDFDVSEPISMFKARIITKMNNDIRYLVKHSDEGKKIAKLHDTYGDVCPDLPYTEDVFDVVLESIEDASSDIAETFVKVNVTEIDLEGRLPQEHSSDPSSRRREIPRELFEFIEDRNRRLGTYAKFDTPPKLDKINLSRNGISDFCGLEKLEADNIFIYCNPIEKIKFRNPRQFINIVNPAVFKKSRLPEKIKSDLIECGKEMETLDKLRRRGVITDLKSTFSYYALTDEDVKKYFDYTDTCGEVYNKIQNSNMCD